MRLGYTFEQSEPGASPSAAVAESVQVLSGARFDKRCEFYTGPRAGVGYAKGRAFSANLDGQIQHRYTHANLHLRDDPGALTW